MLQIHNQFFLPIHTEECNAEPPAKPQRLPPSHEEVGAGEHQQVHRRDLLEDQRLLLLGGEELGAVIPRWGQRLPPGHCVVVGTRLSKADHA